MRRVLRAEADVDGRGKPSRGTVLLAVNDVSGDVLVAHSAEPDDDGVRMRFAVEGKLEGGRPPTESTYITKLLMLKTYQKHAKA